MPLGEIEDAIGMIEEEADENADIIWGTVIKPDMGDEVKVTVIATGFDTPAHAVMPRPEAVPAASGNAGYGEQRAEDLNVPTFIRRQAD